MRRTAVLIVALLGFGLLPMQIKAQDNSSPTETSAVPSPCAELTFTIASATPEVTSIEEESLAAIELLPLDRLAAVVGRDEGAEQGILSLSLPGPLEAIKLSALVESDTAGPIGSVDRVGNELVFTFDEITYAVEPIDLPLGGKIDPQAIRLDQSQPNTLCVDLATGKITRNFHWLMTGTNVEYDGSDTLALGDRGRASVAAVNKIDDDHYTIRLLTHWQSEFELATWSINGRTLPSGVVAAAAEFDGTYTLDFGGS